MAQVPAPAVDAEIERWLASICRALDLDRSAVYERDSPNDPVRPTHIWVRPDFPPFPRKFDPETLTKKTSDWILAGHQLVFSDFSEIPPELADLKRFVIRYGPKASAIIPMFAGGQVIGGVSFGRFRSALRWSPQLLEQLALVVRIFGGAIERKQAGMAVRAARSELALTQRRSMAGELLGSLAHELNQPLGAIVSNLQGVARLLSQGNPDPAMAARAVNNAIEDARRAADIVRRVRAMFKGAETHKTALDLGSLIKEVVELIRGEALFRGITVGIEEPASLPLAIGDRVQIQQVVLNLLMNALDASAQINTGQRETNIRITPEPAGWIQVSISDKGTGVDSAIASRIFEPFITTKANGMGLGLLVTRSIVESHGGKIWFIPNAEGGTTFCFTLPVAEPRRRHPPRQQQPTTTPDGSE
jgi:signal transduction histidine kinase